MAYKLDRAAEFKAGEFHRHYKGGVYEIITLAMQEADGTTLVVYKNWAGETFARPLSEFTEMLPPEFTQRDGYQRFTKISDQAALVDLQLWETANNRKRST